MGNLKEHSPEETGRGRLPPLETGDRLTRAEFERRYVGMPLLRKAELVEGVVYVPSPAKESHGAPHFRINTWMGAYAASTPGVIGGCETTLRLDLENEFQPDAYLRILPERGGQSRTEPEGYVEGDPELVAEIAATSASIDLHAKMRVYRRNGVREYVVWRVLDEAIEWFVLREGEYAALPPDRDGILKSVAFPGLWPIPRPSSGAT